jgi:copper(I)-binding protein
MQELEGPPGMPGRRRQAPGRAALRRAALTRAAVAACALLIGGAALAGCAQKADAAASLQLGTAYVEAPTGGTTEAYLVIQNNGAPDQLTSARTSVGGRVIFRAPARAGADVMKTVPDITIPADATLRLSPAGFHMLITGAGPMRSGGQITLMLTFAKSGTMSVTADVTNPASGGSSYFLD